MLHITIDNMIRFQVTRDLKQRYPEFLHALRRDLVLPNPAFAEAERLGRSTRRIPRELHIYEWNADTGMMAIPRGYWQRLREHLTQPNVAFGLTNQCRMLPAVEFESQIQLRPYQVPAVEAALKMEQGVIEMPCGAGKTSCGLEIIARAAQPALWVTHTSELANQVASRAAAISVPAAEIGFIGSGKRRIGDRLTIGLVQTLCKMNLSEMASLFGLVITDECHHVPASTFMDVVRYFPAWYRFGLTATPNRKDGLESVMYATIGPTIHRVMDADLQAAGQVIVPRLRVIRTEFDAVWDEDFTRLAGLVAKDETRNRLIAGQIAEEIRLGHNCLVLSDRVEHARELQRLIVQQVPGASTAVLTGETPRKERNETVERARTTEIKAVFATKLADEGLDIPVLDRLFLTAPTRAAAKVRQQVGRIMRPAPGKATAVVYDFVDRTGVLRAQHYARRRIYKELGMIG